MSDAPATVATKFYDAFVSKNLDELERLYAPNVHFKDTIFEFSDRAGTMRMWRALLGNPKSTATFRYRLERAEGDVAVVSWEADYALGRRPVHNEIEARLTIRDGLIVDHRDSFSWSKWARQALPLGPLVHVPGVHFVIARLIRRRIG